MCCVLQRNYYGVGVNERLEAMGVHLKLYNYNFFFFFLNSQPYIIFCLILFWYNREFTCMLIYYLYKITQYNKVYIRKRTIYAAKKLSNQNKCQIGASIYAFTILYINGKCLQ